MVMMESYFSLVNWELLELRLSVVRFVPKTILSKMLPPSQQLQFICLRDGWLCEMNLYVPTGKKILVSTASEKKRFP